MSGDKLNIKLFAALKDAAGRAEVSLAWRPGMTSRDVLEELRIHFLSMASLLPHSLVAVNGDHAEPARILMPEDEVAVLPPVSGG